jgi:hypothetical protein
VGELGAEVVVVDVVIVVVAVEVEVVECTLPRRLATE